jgi:hypothetical protein
MIPAKPHQSYEPRVFGFRVHKDSHYWQQPAASSPTAEEALRDVHNNTSNNNYSSPSAKTKGSKVGAPDALPPAPGSAQSTITTGALSALPKPPA